MESTFHCRLTPPGKSGWPPTPPEGELPLSVVHEAPKWGGVPPPEIFFEGFEKCPPPPFSEIKKLLPVPVLFFVFFFNARARAQPRLAAAAQQQQVLLY